MIAAVALTLALASLAALAAALVHIVSIRRTCTRLAARNAEILTGFNDAAQAYNDLRNVHDAAHRNRHARRAFAASRTLK